MPWERRDKDPPSHAFLFLFFVFFLFSPSTPSLISFLFSLSFYCFFFLCLLQGLQSLTDACIYIFPVRSGTEQLVVKTISLICIYKDFTSSPDPGVRGKWFYDYCLACGGGVISHAEISKSLLLLYIWARHKMIVHVTSQCTLRHSKIQSVWLYVLDLGLLFKIISHFLCQPVSKYICMFSWLDTALEESYPLGAFSQR